jgi:hypothetical protein
MGQIDIDLFWSKLNRPTEEAVQSTKKSSQYKIIVKEAIDGVISVWQRTAIQPKHRWTHLRTQGQFTNQWHQIASAPSLGGQNYFRQIF